MVVDVLMQARAKIEKRENWIKGRFAADKAGFEVFSDEPGACRFCAIGSLLATPCSQEEYEEARNFLFVAMEERDRRAYGYSLAGYNDDPKTTHEDILNLFDRAIAASA